VKPHELDIVSLLAGLVFLVLGGVGLLQGAGVVDSGAPWAVIGAIAAVGVTGVVISLRRLAPARAPVPVTPPGEPPPSTLVDRWPEPEDGLDVEAEDVGPAEPVAGEPEPEDGVDEPVD
jgi:hypothetical protein